MFHPLLCYSEAPSRSPDGSRAMAGLGAGANSWFPRRCFLGEVGLLLFVGSLYRLAAAAEGQGPKILARQEESSDEDEDETELTPEELGESEWEGSPGKKRLWHRAGADTWFLVNRVSGEAVVPPWASSAVAPACTAPGLEWVGVWGVGCLSLAGGESFRSHGRFEMGGGKLSILGCGCIGSGASLGTWLQPVL